MANSNRNASNDFQLADNSKLLFVSRRNLARIVCLIAPELVLVNRTQFENIATSMLEVVEDVAAQGAAAGN